MSPKHTETDRGRSVLQLFENESFVEPKEGMLAAICARMYHATEVAEPTRHDARTL